MDRLYSALPLQSGTKQIRVITVEAATEDAPLTASMSVIDMAAGERSFSALSYVWKQEPEQGLRILCDGVAAEISTNCYFALINLREKLGRYTIWVDAICINQGNSDEKAFQIPLMHEIYTGAAQTYIWLGLSSEAQDRGMAYLSRGGLRKYMDGDNVSLLKAVWDLASSKSTAHPIWDEYFAGKVGNKAIIWDDIVKTLEVPWTDRIWTYQEILLASQPIVVCGQQHVPWNTMIDALLLLKGQTNQHGQLLSTWIGMALIRAELQSDLDELHQCRSFSSKAHSYRYGLLSIEFVLVLVLIILSVVGICFGSDRLRLDGRSTLGRGLVASGSVVIGLCCVWSSFLVMRALHVRDNGGLGARESPPNDVLQGLYERKATEKRDVAYGAWNVMRKLGAQDLPEISYTIDEDRVYQQLTTSLIGPNQNPRLNKNLHVLHFAAAAPVKGDYPSWVPDWSGRCRHCFNTDKHQHGVTTKGRPIESQSEAIRLLNEERLSHIARLNHNALIVSARDLAVITQCPNPVTTSPDLLPDEIHGHLKNLKSDLVMREKARDNMHMANSGVFRQLWESEYKIWSKRFESSLNDLETNMHRHFGGQAAPDWYVPWLQEQTSLCNAIAGHGRKYCTIRMHNQPKQDYTAICNTKVQAGDTVLRIRGLLQPLVVQFVKPGCVKLLSPLEVLPLAKNKPHPRRFFRGDLRPFTEIEIH